jgi:hypothetical protein
MGNMAHCRFENTVYDLADCYTALDEIPLDELSDTERRYAIHLVRLCKNIYDDFIDRVEKIEKSKQK